MEGSRTHDGGAQSYEIYTGPGAVVLKGRYSGTGQKYCGTRGLPMCTSSKCTAKKVSV